MILHKIPMHNFIFGLNLIMFELLEFFNSTKVFYWVLLRICLLVKPGVLVSVD